MSNPENEKTKSDPSGALDQTAEWERKMDEEGETHPEGSSQDLPDKPLRPDELQGPNEPISSTAKGG